MMKARKNCMCTAMLYIPPHVQRAERKREKKELIQKRRRESRNLTQHLKLYARWMKHKQYVLLRQLGKHTKLLFACTLLFSPIL